MVAAGAGKSEPVAGRRRPFAGPLEDGGDDLLLAAGEAGERLQERHQPGNVRAESAARDRVALRQERQQRDG